MQHFTGGVLILSRFHSMPLIYVGTNFLGFDNFVSECGHELTYSEGNFHIFGVKFFPYDQCLRFEHTLCVDLVVLKFCTFLKGRGQFIRQASSFFFVCPVCLFRSQCSGIVWGHSVWFVVCSGHSIKALLVGFVSPCHSVNDFLSSE